MSLAFTHANKSSGPLALSATQNGKSISPDQWVRHASPAQTPGVARITAWLEDEALGQANEASIRTDGDAVLVSAALVAALNEVEALSLGLPSATRLRAEFSSRGTIVDPSFKIEVSWASAGGAWRHVQRQGALIREQGGPWGRIPDPLFSMVAAAENISGADDATRISLLHKLTKALPHELGTRALADGFLTDLRVHVASSFSLKLDISTHGFEFDPVLFGHGGPEDDQQDLRSESEALLPPAAQELFARKRFRQFSDARAAYALEDGAYVFVDDHVQKALNVVRKAQGADAQTRKAFVCDPRRYLSEALGETVPAGAIEALFVETQEFSARVTGIDFWRTPVLPWITRQPNTWLPEKFGLRIGEDSPGGPAPTMIELSTDEVAPVAERAREAISEGRASFTVHDLEVPASPATQNALQTLSEIVEIARAHVATPDDDEEDAPPLAGKIFLTVKENLEELETASDQMVLPDPGNVAPAPTVRTKLKPHQLDGLSWAVRNFFGGRRGILLADDMGLGKTLQAIAFMAWLRASDRDAGKRPFLVVAPTGLLENWCDEIGRHVVPDALGEIVRAYGPNLRRMKTAGSQPGRDVDIGRALLDPIHWQGRSVVLTTFETLRDYHPSFARTRFGLAVFDEIQKLKNPAAQATRAAKTLNADFQIGMTGTPVENSLNDLWSIMDVVTPGLLGSSREFARDHEGATQASLSKLRNQLMPTAPAAPHVLRRMKGDHLKGLPIKSVETYRDPMPPIQAEAYQQAVARGIAMRGTGAQGAMLETLANLRGMSLSARSPDDASDEDLIAGSARIARMVSVLEAVANANEKALIFCENLSLQERLSALLQRRFNLPSPPMRISGEVPGRLRQAIVNRFQGRPNSFDVLILSPKAGGVGLTLTAANHVIHLSRWWNPAVEDQATDRVYRIGQDKPVTVHLPLALHPAYGEGSFDAKLDVLLSRKRKLSQDLLGAPEPSQDELAALLEETLSAAPSHARASSPPAATPTQQRPVLSLGRREAPARPPETETSPLQLTELIDFDANTPRDLRRVSKWIAGHRVSRIQVEDGYALAGAYHRQGLVVMLKAINQDAAGIGNVEVRFVDPSDLRDVDESLAHQKFDLREKIKASGMDFPVLLRELPRRRVEHDRNWHLHTEDGQGARYRVRFAFTNSSEALVNTRRKLSVFVVVQRDLAR